MYRSPANDDLRDAHHGSIVVDCCARCGDVQEAETIVHAMLQSSQKVQNANNGASRYFWDEYKTFSYKKVPIQAWTALLKGYVHSGMMAKADSLFRYLCAVGDHGGRNNDGKQRRNWKRDHCGAAKNNGLNVRTLNTLLRGCLWTATSLPHRGTSSSEEEVSVNNFTENELVGGISTAERAWSLCEGNFEFDFDSSSYEYLITLLSQSLQCKRAEECLQKMRSDFHVPDCIREGKDKKMDNTSDAVDPTILESVVVCLVTIARGYSLLGKMKDASRCAEDALYYLDMSAAGNGESTGPSSKNNSSSTKRHATGGKKAWKDGGHSNDKDDANSNGRREQSNKLFRNHRQSELRSEALSLQSLCSQHSDSSSKDDETTNNALHMVQFMMTRLLYFSGGGTTGKDATKRATTTACSPNNSNVDEDIQQWLHSLWHSFGLKEMVQRVLEEQDGDNTLKNIFQLQSSSKTQPKKNKRGQLPNVLSTEVCSRLRHHVGTCDDLSSDGRVNFKQLFASLENGTGTLRNSNGKNNSLHVELGAGSGDWAELQAKLNPTENYVTVELRADRVAQTFSKCVLHQDANDEKSKNVPLTNLCCVGSECGSFLRDRVSPGSVKTIFVNHPEPPTQTYSVAPAGGNTSSNKTNGAGDKSAEEPAHMLNSQIILSAARCLEANGKGRLIIVSDNLIYARLICNTMVRIVEEAKLVGVPPGELRDLRRIESFGHSSIHLYEGKPSFSIGHHIPKKFEGGTSYFDRLWRTGAGKHADTRKRFIIALQTGGGNSRTVNKTKPRGNEQSSKPSTAEKKPNKKKSAEKQRRRNERRLLKKQQLAQKEGKES